MSHTGYHPVLDPTHAAPFPKAVLPVLRNPQLRKNVAHAIDVIQAKRGKLVAEKTDWQELRTAASAIRTHALENLDFYLEQFEERCRCGRGAANYFGPAARGECLGSHQDQDDDFGRDSVESVS
jgi:L-lactate dehydrogenase complex protein LldF